MEGVPTPRKKIGNLAGPYPFYSGTVILRFDVDNHVYYRESGSDLIPVPGCSSIVKIVDKSGPLMGWQAKKISETILANMPCDEDELGKYTRSLPIEEFNSLVMGAKNAPKQILEDAGDVGTQAHKCIEDSIKFALRTDGVVKHQVYVPGEPRAANCVTAALDWMRKHQVKWVETERKVYSRKYGFAGTLDGICYVNSCEDKQCCPQEFKDSLSVADWKSSNALYGEYRLQTAAYEYAVLEEGIAEVGDRFILRLGKQDGVFQPWRIPWSELENDFFGFRSCLEIVKWKERVDKELKEENKRFRTQKSKT